MVNSTNIVLPGIRTALAAALVLMTPMPRGNMATAQTQPEPPPRAPSSDRDDQTQDLAERLVRGESVDQDIMARIIKQMSEVEQRLSAGFDPGAETQSQQQRIVRQLEEAIAASIRQGSRGGASAGATSDKRRRPPKPAVRQKNDGLAGKSGESKTGATATGEPQETDRSGPLRDSRRGWGHLPPRDRDEVLQGVNEKSIERFRRWIERYYQALADQDDQ